MLNGLRAKIAAWLHKRKRATTAHPNSPAARGTGGVADPGRRGPMAPPPG